MRRAMWRSRCRGEATPGTRARWLWRCAARPAIDARPRRVSEWQGAVRIRASRRAAERSGQSVASERQARERWHVPRRRSTWPVLVLQRGRHVRGAGDFYLDNEEVWHSTDEHAQPPDQWSKAVSFGARRAASDATVVELEPELPGEAYRTAPRPYFSTLDRTTAPARAGAQLGVGDAKDSSTSAQRRGSTCSGTTGSAPTARSSRSPRPTSRFRTP